MHKKSYTPYLIKSFLVSSCFLITAFTYGLDLYITPTGSDNNPGTKQKPLASLRGARDRIRVLRKQNLKQERIQVIIAAGTYFMSEPLELMNGDGGTADAPVIYMAASEDRPVFLGGIQVTGFEKLKGHLWRAYVPEVARFGWRFEQLYVNGKRAQRAKFPNEDFFHVKSVIETVVRQGNGRSPDLAAQRVNIYPEQSTLFESFSKEDMDDAVVTFYHNWDNTRKKISRFSASDTAIYIFGEGLKPWNKLDKNTLYQVENARSALDEPNEWYLDQQGYLYYMAANNENVDALKFYAPVNDHFLIIKGTENKRLENIQFKDLSFQVAGYRMPTNGNEPMQAAAFIDATIMIDYANGIQFTNCEIAHTGSHGIWFRKACSDGVIQHCYLHDLGAGAVKIGEINMTGGDAQLTKNITVDNNIIRSGGHVFPCAVALIIFNASDNNITHNEIADFKYSGISVGWTWGYTDSPTKRNKINYNHIHHLGWGELSDMGGVYTLGPSQGTEVNNNVIHHIYSYTYGGWGLYTDEGSTGVLMANNLVYTCKSSGFHQHYGKDNIIRNNIFANQLRAQLEATRIEPHNGFSFINNIVYYTRGDLTGKNWDKANFISDNNIYWDGRRKAISFGQTSFTDWQNKGKDMHSLIADPGFADPNDFNFNFTNQSMISKINFQPFDYGQAGVYGDKAWKELAIFDINKAKKFDEVVKKLEARDVK